jgi:hypothetical protein
MSELNVPPPPDDHGGFDGRDAELFDHAFAACYEVVWRWITADPPGSGPVLYPVERAVPVSAIGSADRWNGVEMDVVQAGAAAGYYQAFSDAGLKPPSPPTEAA